MFGKNVFVCAVGLSMLGSSLSNLAFADLASANAAKAAALAAQNDVADELEAATEISLEIDNYPHDTIAEYNYIKSNGTSQQQEDADTILLPLNDDLNTNFPQSMSDIQMYIYEINFYMGIGNGLMNATPPDYNLAESAFGDAKTSAEQMGIAAIWGTQTGMNIIGYFNMMHALYEDVHP